jgi:hypothetical protein
MACLIIADSHANTTCHPVTDGTVVGYLARRILLVRSMMRTKTAALLFLGIMCAGRAFGHHSYAGVYALDQQKSIEGTVVAFVVQNPHSFLTIEATDAAGQTSRWILEWANASHLKNTGVDEHTLKPGDRLLVTGCPSIDPADLQVLLRKVTRPSDGWSWDGLPRSPVAPPSSEPREPHLPLF